MRKMIQERMEADWVATRNIARLKEQLNAETDDGKASILTQLLTLEFAKLRKPQSGVIESDRVTVDVGNPAKGIVLGVLLIAATTGGFILWDIYQGDADAKAAVAKRLCLVSFNRPCATATMSKQVRWPPRPIDIRFWPSSAR